MTESERFTPWRIVQVSAAIVVLVLFLSETLAILNPALLFVILWAVLLPFRGREGHSALVTILAVLTVAWILAETGAVLAPFFLALVLGYILDPLVDRLAARGLSRSLSVLLLIVPVVGVLAVVVLVVIPAAFAQLGEALESAPVLLQRLSRWIEAIEERLQTIDVPYFDGAQLAERLRAVDSAAVVRFLEERQAALGSNMWEGVLGLGRGLGSVLTIFGYVVLTPVLTFYLIRDWDLVTARLVELVPERRREALVSFSSGRSSSRS